MPVPLSRRRAGARAGAAAAERAVRDELARQRAEKDAVALRAKEAAKARQIERQRFTAADLADATHVHDGYTWRRVVRVNAKTVTVTTAYSWTDHLPLGQIRDHRTIAKEPPCPTS